MSTTSTAWIVDDSGTPYSGNIAQALHVVIRDESALVSPIAKHEAKELGKTKTAHYTQLGTQATKAWAKCFGPSLFCVGKC